MLPHTHPPNSLGRNHRRMRAPAAHGLPASTRTIGHLVSVDRGGEVEAAALFPADRLIIGKKRILKQVGGGQRKGAWASRPRKKELLLVPSVPTSPLGCGPPQAGHCEGQRCPPFESGRDRSAPSSGYSDPSWTTAALVIFSHTHARRVSTRWTCGQVETSGRYFVRGRGFGRLATHTG